MDIFRSYNNTKISDGDESNSENIAPEVPNSTATESATIPSSDSKGKSPLGVVPTATFIPVPGMPNMGTVSTGIRQGVRIYNAAKSGDIQGAMNILTSSETQTFIQDAGQNFRGIIGNKNKPNIGGKGPGGGGPTGMSSYSAGALNANRLSVEPDPIEVRLDTGIKPHTFVDNFEGSDEFYSSPFHMTWININIPNSVSDGDLLGYYNNRAVMFDFVNIIQRNITFAIDLNKLTPQKITAALNDIIEGLQVFYEVSRYLVYTARSRNRNDGVLWFRDSISAQVIDDWMVLRRVLDGIPIPPQLNDLIYYVMQLYSGSELPSSGVIAFSCIPIDIETNLPVWSRITECITKLNDNNSDNRYIYSVIGRAIPEWYETRIKTGTPGPKHDPDFTTVWANAPYVLQKQGAENVMQGPLVDNNESPIIYNSWINNLDGWAYAFMAAYNQGQDKWYPSFIQPFPFTTVDGYTNRLSFYTFHNAYNPWVIPALYPFLLSARCETYVLDAVTNTVYDYHSHYLTTEKARAVTVRTITESSKSLLEWVLDLASVNIRVDKSIATGLPLAETRSAPIRNNNVRQSQPKKGKSKYSGKKSKGKMKDKRKDKDME